MKLYSRRLLPRAKILRQNMTPAEQQLWHQCLRHAPFKFRRQRPVGNYIVDFYCAELKLIIEVDGDVHFDDVSESYDSERTSFLNRQGFRVLRFTNEDVRLRMEAVKEDLAKIFER